MKLREIFIATVCTGIIAGASAFCMADNEDDVQLTLDQVPAPVKVTIQQETQGGTISEISKGDENGQMIYECDATINNTHYEIKIQPSGLLISKEIDNDDNDNDHEDNNKN